MERIVQPELLDTLPPHAPEAIHSRKDLRRVNWWMKNPQLIARGFWKIGPRRMAGTIVEIGAGDGEMVSDLLPLFPAGRNSKLVLVDQQPVVTDDARQRIEKGGRKVEVIASDVFDYFKRNQERIDVVFCNLFLHHFNQERLGDLLRLIANHSDVLLACEPERGLAPYMATYTLGVIGCNHVTRHDARVSVRAGFQGLELTELWPGDGNWKTVEEFASPFSHYFLARKMG